MRKLLALLLLLAHAGHAQVLEQRVEKSDAGKKLAEAIAGWEAKHNVNFYYLPEWIEFVTLDSTQSGKSVGEALDDVLSELNISHVQMNDHVIVLVKDPKNEMRRRETLISAALQKRQVTKIAFGTKSIKSVGQKVSFHGKVQDKE